MTMFVQAWDYVSVVFGITHA